jgi:hypothetical protein
LRIERYADTIVVSESRATRDATQQHNPLGAKMKSKLTELQSHRLAKLMWLYCMECGDESPCGHDGTDIPSPLQLSSLLTHNDIEVSVETATSLLKEELGISDELAAMIEQGFLMPAGWLSN